MADEAPITPEVDGPAPAQGPDSGDLAGEDNSNGDSE